MIEHTPGGATVITGPDQERFGIMALRGALHLEICGLRKRGESAASIVKKRFGFKGTRISLLKQLDEYIEREVRPKMNTEEPVAYPKGV